jgi:MFS family permease
MKSNEQELRSQKDWTAGSPSMIRYRIILVSILMAFSLYLTRNAMPEIVKSESFLQDPTLLSSPSTRFSIELTKAGDTTQLSALLGKDIEQINAPQTIADGLTKDDATKMLRELEASGSDGYLRISKQQIGSIMGVFFFTYALLQVPAGWIGDRLGARKSLSSYIFIWSLLAGVSGMVTSLTGILIARLGFGLAQAGAYPTSSAIVRRWFPLGQRGQSSSLISIGGRLGGAVAPFLTMFLILNIGGWRHALWLYGATGLVVAVVYYWIVRDRPTEHPDCNDSERQLIGDPGDDTRPELREIASSLIRCCKSSSLWLNAVVQFCINMGWAFLVTWLPTYLKEVHQVPEQRGALMVTTILAMGIIGQFMGGRLTDWSVRRFGLRVGRVLPVTVTSFLASVSYLICLGSGSLWVVVGCCAIVSLMTDIGNPSLWAIMQDTGGRNTGSIFGWGNMWGNFGAALHAKLIPMLLASTLGSTYGYGAIFVVCALSFFIAGTCALGMNASKPIFD